MAQALQTESAIGNLPRGSEQMRSAFPILQRRSPASVMAAMQSWLWEGSKARFCSPREGADRGRPRSGGDSV